MRRGDNGIRLWRDPVLGLAGSELACGPGCRFGPVIRQEISIAVIASGEMHYRAGDREGVARAGQFVLVPAGVAFAGDGAWTWCVYHADLGTLAEMSGVSPVGPPPRGPQPGVPSGDPERGRRLLTLHGAIVANTDNPEARQQAFAEAIGLALGGALPPGWPCRPGPEHPAIRRAIACVHRRFHDPALSVAVLAAAAGCSPYHFMRSFQSALGITAHAYVVQRRLGAARIMLAGGTAAAEVASTCGFADQSHLIRQFKALHGLTPGQYAENCRRLGGARPAAPGERWGRASSAPKHPSRP